MLRRNNENGTYESAIRATDWLKKETAAASTKSQITEEVHLDQMQTYTHDLVPF
jgi:hypothetical protein